MCNITKPYRRGGNALQPMGILEYPWEIIDIDYFTDLPKSGTYGYTNVLILVCHLTQMVHSVPYHNQIIAEESTYLFISNCYKLHGVPKDIISDRDPKFAGKCWQSFVRKLNSKLNMSIARHPRTDGLIDRVNPTMQALLRCYCDEPSFKWTSHLSMVKFYYSCSINEATSHSPFEVMYGFQPSTLAKFLLPLTSALAEAADRSTVIAHINDVVYESIKLSKERMKNKSTRNAPLFQLGDIAYLSTKDLHIRS